MHDLLALQLSYYIQFTNLYKIAAFLNNHCMFAQLTRMLDNCK